MWCSVSAGGTGPHVLCTSVFTLQTFTLWPHQPSATLILYAELTLFHLFDYYYFNDSINTQIYDIRTFPTHAHQKHVHLYSSTFNSIRFCSIIADTIALYYISILLVFLFDSVVIVFVIALYYISILICFILHRWHFTSFYSGAILYFSILSFCLYYSLFYSIRFCKKYISILFYFIVTLLHFILCYCIIK